LSFLWASCPLFGTYLTRYWADSLGSYTVGKLIQRATTTCKRNWGHLPFLGSKLTTVWLLRAIHPATLVVVRALSHSLFIRFARFLCHWKAYSETFDHVWMHFDNFQFIEPKIVPNSKNWRISRYFSTNLPRCMSLSLYSFALVIFIHREIGHEVFTPFRVGSKNGDFC
jgi:hypothetical protein